MRVLTIFLSMLGVVAFSQERVISDIRSGSVLARAEIGAFQTASARRGMLRLLAAKEIRVGKIVRYRSERDRLRGAPQGGTDCSYEGWRSVLARRRLTVEPLSCPEFAQAIKIGGAVLYRSLDARCTQNVAVLQGDADPTRVRIAEADFEVLDIAIAGTPGHNLIPRVTLYARTTADVTTSRAQRLLEYFQKVTDLFDIVVVLRSDVWFITHCELPPLLLFALSEPIPSKDEFLKTKEAVCAVLQPWPLRCY